MDRLTERNDLRGIKYIKLKGDDFLFEDTEAKFPFHNAVFRLAELEDRLERGELVEVVRCAECKHLYFKDMSAYCRHKVGACRPYGFCSCGEQNTKQKLMELIDTIPPHEGMNSVSEESGRTAISNVPLMHGTEGADFIGAPDCI